jgi:ketosteroid isomerase-like protein
VVAHGGSERRAFIESRQTRAGAFASDFLDIAPHTGACFVLGMSQDAIQAAEDELLRAMQSSDVDALDRLIHDDLLFLAPDGSLATKAMDLENYRTGAQIVQSARRKSLTVAVHDDDLAVSAALVELELVFRGQPVVGDFQYIRTWKRQAGAWRIVAGAVMPAPATRE